MLLYFSACNTPDLFLWAVTSEKNPHEAWLDKTQKFVFLNEHVVIISFDRNQRGHYGEGVSVCVCTPKDIYIQKMYFQGHHSFYIMNSVMKAGCVSRVWSHGNGEISCKTFLQ